MKKYLFAIAALGLTTGALAQEPSMQHQVDSVFGIEHHHHHHPHHHHGPDEHHHGPHGEMRTMGEGVPDVEPNHLSISNKQMKVELYGFVRNYFTYDTRRNYTTINGLFYEAPLDEKIAANGDDLNEQGSANLLAMTTRLGLRLKGPEVLGARSFGNIEADFSGQGSSNTMFRIRQAYVRLDWKKNRVTMGQTWHPMYGEVYPDVLSLNSGSPFQPFSRAPQLRYDYKLCDNFRLTADALYQFQYMSVGPGNVASAKYLSDGVLPNLYFGFDWKPENFIVGAGVDICRIRPRVTNDAIVNGVKAEVNVDDNVTGFSPMVFVQYKKDMVTVKAKGTYAQNAPHLDMLNGYGESEYDENTGETEYTTLNTMAGWVDFAYGKRTKFNLFAGLAKNLGTSDEVKGEMYTRGDDTKKMDLLYRLAPSLSYNLKALQLGVEYEATGAYFGTPDAKYKIEDTHSVVNHRILGMVKYNF